MECEPAGHKPSLHRVMFDTNAGTSEHGYWLWFDRSEWELSAIGPDLQPGLVVTIYMPEELEMEATLRLDRNLLNGQHCWMADPIADTVRYYDGEGHSNQIEKC